MDWAWDETHTSLRFCESGALVPFTREYLEALRTSISTKNTAMNTMVQLGRLTLGDSWSLPPLLFLVLLLLLLPPCVVGLVTLRRVGFSHCSPFIPRRASSARLGQGTAFREICSVMCVARRRVQVVDILSGTRCRPVIKSA